VVVVSNGKSNEGSSRPVSPRIAQFKDSRNAKSALSTMLQKFAFGAEVLREEVTTANGVTSVPYAARTRRRNWSLPC
jgi:hypothetical protein